MTIEFELVLNGYRSLPEVMAPLAYEASQCFWVVDVQSGPFDSLWLYDSPGNEELVDKLRWGIPGPSSSTSGFRPGALPRLAGHLLVDEWSYYFAILAPENEALRRAIELSQHIGDFSTPFLSRLDDLADLFLCHLDGWWEFYTGRADWHRRLLQSWPECYERPITLAGKGP